MKTAIHKHLNDAEQINMEIFRLWFAGKGEQPVAWGTLVKVLHDVKFTIPELVSNCHIYHIPMFSNNIVLLSNCNLSKIRVCPWMMNFSG